MTADRTPRMGVDLASIRMAALLARHQARRRLHATHDQHKARRMA